MKRKLCKLFCICAIAFSMMGCGASDKIEVPDLIRGDAPVHNNELIQIGMIQTGKESDWRDANTNDYLDTFVPERGYELIYIDGNSSSERQVKAMYDLIQQRVDYIILQPIVETGWDDAITEAKMQAFRLSWQTDRLRQTIPCIRHGLDRISMKKVSRQ